MLPIVADDGLGLVQFDDAAFAQNIAAVALVSHDATPDAGVHPIPVDAPGT